MIITGRTICQTDKRTLTEKKSEPFFLLSTKKNIRMVHFLVKCCYIRGGGVFGSMISIRDSAKL